MGARWHAGGHLGPVSVRWVHGCGDLVISKEQVIGGEHGADTATCHQGPMWLLWNTSMAGQCSGILSVILSTFIRIKDLYIKGSQESQGMLKIFQVVLIQILMWVWVSAVEAVEHWSSGPMMTDTTWPDPDHESVVCSPASPWTNVASDNSAQQINVQRFQIRHKYYSLGAAGQDCRLLAGGLPQ